MRFSLFALIRLIGLVSIVMVLAAIGVSRSLPKHSDFRSPVSPRYLPVDGWVLNNNNRNSYALDTETGQMSRLPIADGEVLDYAVCSPWPDEKGAVEIVGRVTRRSGVDLMKSLESVGLARFSLVEGATRGEVEVEPVIAGRPCWLWGSATKVIFPGGDAQLFLQDLAEAPESSASQALVWTCKPPGLGRVTMSDPVCPMIEAMKGCLVVSMAIERVEDGRRAMGAHQLWWLKLDPEGSAIEAAGRLWREGNDEESNSHVGEWLPELVSLPDGRVVLAYLHHVEGSPRWSLRMSLVNVDPTDGTPSVSRSNVCQVADDCVRAPLGFSTDRQWIYRVSREPGVDGQVVRKRVQEALAASAMPFVEERIARN